MKKSKGRIAKIFDNLKFLDNESTNTNIQDFTRETYIVNSNGSLSLESIKTETLDRKSKHVVPSVITIEGHPKNILLTKDKDMMLNPSENDEYKVCDLQPDTNLIQSAITASVPSAFGIGNEDICTIDIAGNKNEYLSETEGSDPNNGLVLSTQLTNVQIFTQDNYNLESDALLEIISQEFSEEQCFKQVTVFADIHEEPDKILCNDPIESNRTIVLNRHDENLDMIEIIGNTNNKLEIAIENDEISKIVNSSPVSPSILNCSLDDNSSNTQENNYISQEMNLNESTDDDNDVTDLQKRKRKRKADKESWEKTKNMKLREEGKEYCGRMKEEGAWKYDKPRNARKLKPRCDCKLSNKDTKLQCSKISEEERQNIFEYFWKMTWKEKKVYVRTLVSVKEKKRKRGKESTSRRNNSIELYLEKNTIKIRVCKTMFLNTLSVGEWALKDWAKKKDSTGVIVQEQVSKKEMKREQVKHFLTLLPKLESHYCRKQTSKLYLETIWESKSQLLKIYNEKFCEERGYDRVSVATFNDVFDEMNLSLYQPKKDACTLCEQYKTNNVSEDTYREHIQRKESARREKEKDKISEKEVFTMDLQAVQLCPKSNVSALYFKTKLAVPIFTGYDIKRSEGYCYIWNETEGGLTANEFASVIVKMLELFMNKNNIKERTEIVLFSDGCTYQNRNSVLSNALLNFAVLKNVTIVQKILEKGHTQMEADSMHSVIERKVRKKKINIPADYVEIAKTACQKNPYYVQYIDHTYFRNFESGLNFYKSIRPGTKTGDPCVTDLRQLTYLPEGKIYYRLGFTDDCPELLLPHRIKQIKPRRVDELPPLYTERLKIKKSKFNHLQELKLTLETDFHAFYDALPYMKTDK